MDFIRVAYKEKNDGTREFYPSLQALESQDLVIRGGQFVAIWDEDTNLYSRQLSHVPDIVDRSFAKMVKDTVRQGDVVKRMRSFDNQLYSRLLSLIRSIGDMGPELDQKLIFADQDPVKSDAATFKMNYSLSQAPAPAWEEIVSMLYNEDERTKIEWAIGSILSGAAADQIQKFYVLFGPPGSGKTTIMNIIESIFHGHTVTFSAFDMGKLDSQFSLEPFARNPLLAMDHDADLSRLETNRNLNSIVSHDQVLINSKGKSLFSIKPRATLFVSTNDPVKINNRKSGVFRRLVDIQPSGRLIDEDRYHILMAQVQYELGSIAMMCMDVFEGHGATYLSSYRSNDMMYRTNDIFNFVDDNRMILEKGCSLKQVHKMYVDWCDATETKNVYKQFQFRDLMKDYFKEFHTEIMIDGVRYRSWFKDLRPLDKFTWVGLTPAPPKSWLKMDVHKSFIDDLLKDEPAQLASVSGTPKKAWSEVTTTLKDIDTAVEHFVKVPTQHIVIDFDLKDEHGHKSIERNLEAAASWPPTYAEISRGGGGLHLHYDYDGDVERLANRAEDGSFEVKTLLGGSSLRRRLSLCNAYLVATISSGLPLKEEKVLSSLTMQTEKGLRALILNGLRKDVHVGTKSNMDFIKMVTDEAYNDGLVYDVSDMWDDILSFAMNSTHQKTKCIEIAMSLQLKSEEEPDAVSVPAKDAPLAYFDLEVYPNLLAIGYMFDEDNAEVVKMINPSASEVEELFKLKLVGYNNRNYDNHIMWARTLGYDNKSLFELSQDIIVNNNRHRLFGAAYNLAYGDLYDIIVDKKSLKWWEIHLGLPHKEMDLPWDKPVPEDRMIDVMDYLENDVRSTRAVAKHREADFRARQILAELTGLEVCNTNRQHTEKLVFPDLARDAQPDLVYTDLAEKFPGYTFDQFASGKEKSTYKGYKVGEGGWVKASPGTYDNVAVLDVASMHPTSIVELNLFGEYTNNFKQLLDARLAIKRGDLDGADRLFNGQLKSFLGDKDTAKGLADALKIVINSVYGLTAASFPNKFRDDRNKDNIVAKRGALFMVDVVEFVEKAGFKVVHVKTDSIKIPNATPQIIDEVWAFGLQYGYVFEHEATYERFCLVNDAVYIAKYGWAKDAKKIGTWDATGAQFAHPVVLKTLFTGEELEFKDYVEVKQVTKGAMYLVSEVQEMRQFVGRFGAFVPVLGGRTLLRIDGEKEYAVNNTKGYLWELADIANHKDVDMNYFQGLIDAARTQVEKYGSYAEFTRA